MNGISDRRANLLRRLEQWLPTARKTSCLDDAEGDQYGLDHRDAYLVCAILREAALPPDAPATPEGFEQATPRPWKAEAPVSGGIGADRHLVYISIFGNKRRVSSVSVYGKKPDGTTAGKLRKDGSHATSVPEAEALANAALIVAAVNAYDGGAEVAAMRAELARMEQRQCDLVSERDEARERVATLEAALRPILARLYGQPAMFEGDEGYVATPDQEACAAEIEAAEAALGAA